MGIPTFLQKVRKEVKSFKHSSEAGGPIMKKSSSICMISGMFKCFFAIHSVAVLSSQRWLAYCDKQREGNNRSSIRIAIYTLAILDQKDAQVWA